MTSDTTDSTARPTLVPTGDVTIFEAAEFRDSVVTLLMHDGPVELDLSGIERVDGAGIQLVLAAERHGRCQVTRMSPSIRRAFEELGYAPGTSTRS